LQQNPQGDKRQGQDSSCEEYRGLGRSMQDRPDKTTAKREDEECDGCQCQPNPRSPSQTLLGLGRRRMNHAECAVRLHHRLKHEDRRENAYG